MKTRRKHNANNVVRMEGKFRMEHGTYDKFEKLTKEQKLLVIERMKSLLSGQTKEKYNVQS